MELNIKQALEDQLKEINDEFEYATSKQERAMLLIAKTNILLGLQKYE